MVAHFNPWHGIRIITIEAQCTNEIFIYPCLYISLHISHFSTHFYSFDNDHCLKKERFFWFFIRYAVIGLIHMRFISARLKGERQHTSRTSSFAPLPVVESSVTPNTSWTLTLCNYFHRRQVHFPESCISMTTLRGFWELHDCWFISNTEFSG